MLPSLTDASIGKQFPSKDKLAAAKAIGNWHVEQFVKTMVDSDVQEKDMEKYRNVVLEVWQMFHSEDSLNSSGQGNNNNSNNTSNNLKNSTSSTSPLPVISSSSALLDILEIKSIPKNLQVILSMIKFLVAILIQSVFKGYKVRKSISNYQYRKSSLMLQNGITYESGHDERVRFLKHDVLLSNCKLCYVGVKCVKK